MRGLNRNKRQIYYAHRIGEEKNTDKYGNETGETTPLFGTATPLLCNVSAAIGADMAEAFGNITSYTRVICVADNDCPISEESIVWFDAAPSGPHNYIVVRKADSKNGALYALQEVKVT